MAQQLCWNPHAIAAGRMEKTGTVAPAVKSHSEDELAKAVKLDQVCWQVHCMGVTLSGNNITLQISTSWCSVSTYQLAFPSCACHSFWYQLCLCANNAPQQLQQQAGCLPCSHHTWFDLHWCIYRLLICQSSVRCCCLTGWDPQIWWDTILWLGMSLHMFWHSAQRCRPSCMHAHYNLHAWHSSSSACTVTTSAMKNEKSLITSCVCSWYCAWMTIWKQKHGSTWPAGIGGTAACAHS